MRSIFFLLLLILLCSCGQTGAELRDQPKLPSLSTPSLDPASFIGNDYLMDAQHSYIGFKIKYFGFSPVRGRFDAFDGTLLYDPSDLSSLSVTVFLDVNSINTGDETRDEDLKREGTWFDAKTFPVIRFQSTEVLPTSEGGFDLIGDLTIKGITQSDTIAFEAPTQLSKDWAGNDQVDFSGRMMINRQDFEVFGGDFWSSVMENGLTQLSDEVEIELDIHARKADYQIRYEDADSTDLRKIVLDQIKAKGVERGVPLLDSLFQEEELSSGKLSTIGYTLNAWKMHKEASMVFQKRAEYYPEKISSQNQLGITNLFLNKLDIAKDYFQSALDMDSTDSRAHEYARLIQRMD